MDHIVLRNHEIDAHEDFQQQVKPLLQSHHEPVALEIDARLMGWILVAV